MALDSSDVLRSFSPLGASQFNGHCGEFPKLCPTKIGFRWRESDFFQNLFEKRSVQRLSCVSGNRPSPLTAFSLRKHNNRCINGVGKINTAMTAQLSVETSFRASALFVSHPAVGRYPNIVVMNVVLTEHTFGLFLCFFSGIVHLHKLFYLVVSCIPCASARPLPLFKHGELPPPSQKAHAAHRTKQTKRSTRRAQITCGYRSLQMFRGHIHVDDRKRCRKCWHLIRLAPSRQLVASTHLNIHTLANCGSQTSSSPNLFETCMHVLHCAGCA